MRNWVKDTVTQLPRQFVWALLGAFIVGAGADIIGFYQSIPVFLYLPLGLACAVLTLMAIIMILQIRDRFKKEKVGGLSEEDLEKTLSEWLLMAGYQVSRSDSPADIFTLVATDKLGRNINITRLIDDPDRLSIYEGYTLSDDQINALASLSQDVSAEIFEDLRIDLATFDIELGTVPEALDKPATNFYLRDNVIFAFLFSEDEFFRRLSYVRRATTVVTEYLRRALRISAAKSQGRSGEDLPTEEAS